MILYLVIGCIVSVVFDVICIDNNREEETPFIYLIMSTIFWPFVVPFVLFKLFCLLIDHIKYLHRRSR